MKELRHLPERHTDFVFTAEVDWRWLALLTLLAVAAGIGIWRLVARRRRR